MNTRYTNVPLCIEYTGHITSWSTSNTIPRLRHHDSIRWQSQAIFETYHIFNDIVVLTVTHEGKKIVRQNGLKCYDSCPQLY